MDNMKVSEILCRALVLFVFTMLAGCSAPVDQQSAVKPLFLGRHGWDLKQISISDTETGIDFKRVDCVWVVGHDHKPADETRVTALAEKLVTMTPQDVSTIGPDRYSDFKVGEDNFSLKVVLTFKDDTSHTLLLGTPALTKPAYVRIAGGNVVYLVDEPLIKQIHLAPGSWLASEEG
jgi:hypothetical protein